MNDRSSREFNTFVLFVEHYCWRCPQIVPSCKCSALLRSNTCDDEPCHCCCCPIEDQDPIRTRNDNDFHYASDVPISRPHIPFKGNVAADPILSPVIAPKPPSLSLTSTSSARSGSTVTSISLSTSTSTSACVSPRTSQSTHVPPFRAPPFTSPLTVSRASPLTLSTLPYTQSSSVLSRTSSLSSIITTRSNTYGRAVIDEPLWTVNPLSLQQPRNQ